METFSLQVLESSINIEHIVYGFLSYMHDWKLDGLNCCIYKLNHSKNKILEKMVSGMIKILVDKSADMHLGHL